MWNLSELGIFRKKNIPSLPGLHIDRIWWLLEMKFRSSNLVYNTFAGKEAMLFIEMCDLLGFAVGISLERTTSTWSLFDASEFSKKFQWTRGKMGNFNDICLRWLVYFNQFKISQHFLYRCSLYIYMFFLEENNANTKKIAITNPNII